MKYNQALDAGRFQREDIVFLLAGGLGTRIRESLPPGLPKCLAPVNGVPLLLRIIPMLEEQGLNTVVLVLGYQADQIVQVLSQVSFRLNLNYLIEDSPLGTGGAIKNALSKLDFQGNFYVINSDTWLGGISTQFLNTPSPALGAVLVSNTSRFGFLQIQNNRVEEFKEKTGEEQRGWINAGIYKLRNEDFEIINGDKFSLEADVLPILVQNKKLSVAPVSEVFFDIGVPEDYAACQRYFEALDQ